MYPTETEVDNVSDCAVTTAAVHEDPTVAEFLADRYRNEAALTDADLERMHAAATADGLDAAPFGDLTAERWDAIMRMCPERTGWSPEVALEPGDLPYRAQLRRGTPDGPDMVRLARFSSAEYALTCAVLFLIRMKLAHDYGDDEAKDCMRRQIEYANRQA